MDLVHVVYALEDIPDLRAPSIFLAGPTPRVSYVKSWRPQALGMIRRHRKELVVYYPEPATANRWSPDADDHVNWEREALARANVILFWVPRHLEQLPGFRTNTEWGFWTARDPSRLVLGHPHEAPGMRGMDNDARTYRIPILTSLTKTVDLSVGLACATRH